MGEARQDGLKLPRAFARIGLLVAIVFLVVAVAAQVGSSGREKPGVVEAVAVPNGSTGTYARAATSSSSPTGADKLLPVGYRVGEKAPDFVLRNTNGRQVSLGGLRGQPALINFWASWCTYCRVEMPELDALYKEDSVRHSLVVLAVDTLDSDRLSAESFIVNRAFSFTVLWDENDRVASQYDVRSLPASFFIDRDGIIRAYSPGAMGRDEMREKAELVY